METKKLIPLFILATLLPFSCGLNINNTQLKNHIEKKGTITKEKPILRMANDINSIYNAAHAEKFGDYQVENERSLLGTSLTSRYILRTYLGGGYSIFDCLDQQFAEYSFAGTNPYLDAMLHDSLLYIGPSCLCFRLSDGTYQDNIGNIYTENALLVMDQEETELKQLQAQYAATHPEEEDDSDSNSGISLQSMVKPDPTGGGPTHPEVGQRPNTVNHDLNNDGIADETLIANYAFFTNLLDYGNNIDGSCTIIAMEMLFCYYDALFDESFIDEFWGTDSKTFMQSGYDSLSDFYSSPGTGGFDADLKLLAIEFGYSSNCIFGLTYAQMRHIFNYYLQTDRGFVLNTDFTVQGIENNYWDRIAGNCKKRVKREINAGIPQIFVYSTENTLHASIAYGYSDDFFILQDGNISDAIPTYVNQKYAVNNLGIGEWKKPRVHDKVSRRFKSINGDESFDPLIDLGASPSGVTHSTFKEPTRAW